AGPSGSNVPSLMCQVPPPLLTVQPVKSPVSKLPLVISSVVARPADAEPPSSSVSVKPMGYWSDGVPLGLSSRYRWLAVNVVAPAGRVKLSTLPSPQYTFSVKLSSVPGSVIVPLSVATSFSLIGEVTWTLLTVGATLRTVNAGPVVTRRLTSSRVAL